MKPPLPECTDMYTDAQEELPEGIPGPLGRQVQSALFADAALADDLDYAQINIGYYRNHEWTLMRCYSTQQITVEGSTHGSGFITLSIATAMITALRSKDVIFNSLD